MTLSTRASLEWMIKSTGGVKVTTPLDQTWGHYEIVDELIMDGQVIVGAPTLRVPSAVQGFTEGAAISVAGHGGFITRFSQRIEDGSVRRVALHDPTGGS